MPSRIAGQALASGPAISCSAKRWRSMQSGLGKSFTTFRHWKSILAACGTCRQEDSRVAHQPSGTAHEHNMMRERELESWSKHITLKAVYEMYLSLLLLLLLGFWTLSFVNSASNDDLFTEDFLEWDEVTSSPWNIFETSDLFSSDVASTECAFQPNPMDELSLLPRGDDDFCGLPLPLSSDTLQLFQDPLNSLEQTLPTVDIPEKIDSDRDASEAPASVQQKGDLDPCVPFQISGHQYHVCCMNVLGEYPDWRMAWDCSMRVGTFLTQENRRAFHLSAANRFYSTLVLSQLWSLLQATCKSPNYFWYWSWDSYSHLMGTKVTEKEIWILLPWHRVCGAPSWSLTCNVFLRPCIYEGSLTHSKTTVHSNLRDIARAQRFINWKAISLHEMTSYEWTKFRSFARQTSLDLVTTRNHRCDFSPPSALAFFFPKTGIRTCKMNDVGNLNYDEEGLMRVKKSKRKTEKRKKKKPVTVQWIFFSLSKRGVRDENKLIRELLIIYLHFLFWRKFNPIQFSCTSTYLVGIFISVSLPPPSSNKPYLTHKK